MTTNTSSGAEAPAINGRSDIVARPVRWHHASGFLGSVSGCMREFDPFRLDTVNQCLWRRGDAGQNERIVLTPKAFAVLCYLVEHAGRLVTQDELLQAVWPDTFVQPEVLKHNIFNIRIALGDHPKKPLFIETLPRRGYEFIATVRQWEPAESAAPATPPKRTLAGRDRELGLLRACLQETLQGQRQIVFVTGEPGIGKTALVDEFQRQAAIDEPYLRIAHGQCVESYGRAEAYYAMLEALGELCHGSEGHRFVEILAAQAPTWLVQFPELLTHELRQVLQQEVLGATRDRMLREIRVALDTITLEAPLLLVFEDLHWADPSTVDLISALARSRGPAKLMVLGTYRPAEVESSNYPLKALTLELLVHRLCDEIALDPLTEAEIDLPAARKLASQSFANRPIELPSTTPVRLERQRFEEFCERRRAGNTWCARRDRSDRGERRSAIAKINRRLHDKIL